MRYLWHSWTCTCPSGCELRCYRVSALSDLPPPSCRKPLLELEFSRLYILLHFHLWSVFYDSILAPFTTIGIMLGLSSRRPPQAYGGGHCSQRYVEKLLNLNIHCNTSQSTGLRERTPKIKNHQKATKPGRSTNLNFLTLDWETDSALSLPSVLVDSKRAEDHTINIVLACDCIYNETLIAPLVRTCAEICQGVEAKPSKMPTICVIAQQLRSPDVFEAWLTSFSEVFRVWRVPDSLLSDELNKDSGFAVHIGINRSREMQ